MSEFWSDCLSHLKQKLSVQQYDAWIRPLTAQQQEGRILVTAPSRKALEWVREQYLPDLQKLADQRAGESLIVEIEVGARSPTAISSSPGAATPVASNARISTGDLGRAYLPAAGLTELARYTVPTLVDLEDVAEKEARVLRVGPGRAACSRWDWRREGIATISWLATCFATAWICSSLIAPENEGISLFAEPFLICASTTAGVSFVRTVGSVRSFTASRAAIAAVGLPAGPWQLEHID